MDISNELAVRMYKNMFTIRTFEEEVITLFRNGFIPGWVHSYIGQEAVATGACFAIENEDFIFSTHRGHGHCISKGADLKKMMAELFAKTTGYCKGKGGSMHICDPSSGILGVNGIVGGGIPIATGTGFACKYLKTKRVCLVFFGDGASNQGSFHESINLASLWNLPVVYICENNLYGNTVSQKRHQNIENIADRAKAYNIPGVISDGMDVFDVYQKVSNAVDRARNGDGPTLVEAKTYRYMGHYDGDPQVYRTEEEIDSWKKRDCIQKLEGYLFEKFILDEEQIISIQKKIRTEIGEAIEFAKSSPEPIEKSALEDIFV
ncbi:MAG: thiamine pyrophosphate-dependent dehydrogenase E1 component subunit alpha [Actinobacteria bacterium]|nr:thiamine pyrophosphate-dependent dehydrogenase E1 component subunit alpha [Actinomycetota bacterium]